MENICYSISVHAFLWVCVLVSIHTSGKNFEIILLVLVTGPYILARCVFLWKTLFSKRQSYSPAALFSSMQNCFYSFWASSPAESVIHFNCLETLFGPPDKQSNSVTFSQGRFTAPIGGFQVNRVKKCSHCFNDSEAECKLCVQESLF